ncbi:MAG: hypothetical protein JXA25_15505 [Anaerolineales bacterium]|nr:hypothetical protein [Anaerolineales bacterium]
MKNKRWIIPITFISLSACLWLSLYVIEPKALVLRFLESGNSVFLDMSPTEFIMSGLAAFKIVAWISLTVSIITALVAWLRPASVTAAAVFAFGSIVYAISSIFVISGQSTAPHYVYLADAFLDGDFVLAEKPPYSEENDWTYFEGEWSVSFPPSPALLMMPFVAIWGQDFNDVIFTLLLGALNLLLIYELFGKICIHEKVLPVSARLFLTGAFGFGTVHWWLSTNGMVWFTAHIAAATFLLLTLIETFEKRRPWLVALWLGLAALARPPVLFALPAVIWLLRPHRSWREIGVGSLPLLAIGGLMAIYNQTRYGNPFELGYTYMKLEALLARRVEEFGSFNTVFFKENFHHAFLNTGEWRKSFPYLVLDGWGLSLFISTPVLVCAFFAPLREKSTQALLLGVFLVAIPNLLYYNAGYLQAGYRYALDFLPFMFSLAALAWRGRNSFLGRVLSVLSVLSILTGFLMLINSYSLYLGIIF